MPSRVAAEGCRARARVRMPNCKYNRSRRSHGEAKYVAEARSLKASGEAVIAVERNFQREFPTVGVFFVGRSVNTTISVTASMTEKIKCRT